jgi:hypothetical protein
MITGDGNEYGCIAVYMSGTIDWTGCRSFTAYCLARCDGLSPSIGGEASVHVTNYYVFLLTNDRFEPASCVLTAVTPNRVLGKARIQTLSLGLPRDQSVFMCRVRLLRAQIFVTRYIQPSQISTGVASSTSARSEDRPVGKVMTSG